MALTFGFELELAANTLEVVYLLQQAGLTGSDELHGYHCDCELCNVTFREVYKGDGSYEVLPAFDIRAQRDSTVDGELISRVLDNFDDLRTLGDKLATAIQEGQASVASNCGLHVHVSARGCQTVEDVRDGFNPGNFTPNVALAYLFTERYLAEMVAPGATSQKRDMNQTLMQAVRNYLGGSRNYTVNDDTAAMLLYDAISSDRHVDLNYSRNNNTWEFRVFNAPVQSWRLELACRLAVSFVERHQEIIEATLKNFVIADELPQLILAGSRYSTMRPRITLGEFIQILCRGDRRLKFLVMKQCDFMRSRYRKELFDDTVLPPEQNEAPLAAVTEGLRVDSNGNYRPSRGLRRRANGRVEYADGRVEYALYDPVPTPAIGLHDGRSVYGIGFDGLDPRTMAPEIRVERFALGYDDPLDREIHGDEVDNWTEYWECDGSCCRPGRVSGREEGVYDVTMADAPLSIDSWREYVVWATMHYEREYYDAWFAETQNVLGPEVIEPEDEEPTGYFDTVNGRYTFTTAPAPLRQGYREDSPSDWVPATTLNYSSYQPIEWSSTMSVRWSDAVADVVVNDAARPRTLRPEPIFPGFRAQVQPEEEPL